MTAVRLETYWGELVTTALLGTDRRDPPPLPAGPIADVVDDSVHPDAASRMLAAVAAVAAARRSAFLPLPPAGFLRPPVVDDRPQCPPSAAATWRLVVRDWPVLEDEWVLTSIDRGYRLPPDVLVEMLALHRGDPVRSARTVLAAGPIAGWLTDQLPDLAPTSARQPSAEAVGSLPDLAIPPELAELVALDARTFVRRLLPGFEAGRYGPAHRAVLVNLLARCRPAVLADAARALAAQGDGLALALSDLCRLRHRMLDELGAT